MRASVPGAVARHDAIQSWSGSAGTMFNETAYQFDRVGQLPLFVDRQRFLYLSEKPVLSGRATGLHTLAARIRQGEQGLPAVVRIRTAADLSSRFERRDDLAHRLRADTDIARQLRQRNGFVLFQTKQHCFLRRREVARVSLFPEPPLQLSGKGAHILGQAECEGVG